MENTAATVPAWLAVVLSIATLGIGVALPILTHRLQSAEDRIARAEIRDDARRDRQRAELLELQDALTEAQQVLAAAAYDQLAGAGPTSSVKVIGVRARVEAMMVRVEDDSARSLGRDFANGAVKLLSARNQAELTSFSGELGKAMTAFHERVRVLLRDL